MIDHQSRRYKRGASHYWAETGQGVACHWCGMRAHWAGSRLPCAFPSGGKKGPAPRRVERPEVEVESVIDSEKAVRW